MAHLEMLHLLSVVRWKSSNLLALQSEDDSVRFHIDLALDITFHDELRGLLHDWALFESKLILNGLDSEGLILILALQEVDFQCNLLDLLLEHLFKRSLRELSHLVEDFDLADVGEAFLPLALTQVSGGEHNEVSRILSCKLDALEIVLLNELPEVSVDHIFMDLEPILAQIWHLKEHGSSHVDAVKQLQVHMKMIWCVSLLLFNFLLKGLFLLP